MMKTLVLIFTVFSISAFGQQKRNLTSDLNDSLAKKNVNSIIINSKKSFSNLNLDLQTYSEMNKNTDQLIMNTINFNTAINNRSVNQIDMGSYGRPRFDAMDLISRDIMSVPVYKAK